MIKLFEKHFYTSKKDIQKISEEQGKHHYKNVRGYPILESKETRKERMKRLKDYRVQIIERTPINQEEEKVIIKVRNELKHETNYFEYNTCIYDEETDEEIIQNIFFEIDMVNNIEHTKKMLDYIKNGGLDEIEQFNYS